MSLPAVPSNSASIGTLLRGEVAVLSAWTSEWRASQVGRDVLLIVLGTGLFGAALGYWRDPWQSLYAGLKLPLILLLTALANSVLNLMLAPLLGLRISFRQSVLAILTSFALAATILGAFSPLAAFVIWNAPPLGAGSQTGLTHSALLLLLAVVVAFAGIAANLRLFQLLRKLAGEESAAWRVLMAWLTANLFFGSQLSWILRPFIGSPYLPVEFLRPDAFNGNFFESLFHSTVPLFN